MKSTDQSEQFKALKPFFSKLADMERWIAQSIHQDETAKEYNERLIDYLKSHKDDSALAKRLIATNQIIITAVRGADEPTGCDVSGNIEKFSITLKMPDFPITEMERSDVSVTGHVEYDPEDETRMSFFEMTGSDQALEDEIKVLFSPFICQLTHGFDFNLNAESPIDESTFNAMVSLLNAN